MSLCNGNGECLNQCVCECFNYETEVYDEICVCGHREHNGYCPSTCCQPVECRNYKYCKVKQPQWVSFCVNGLCMNCVVQMGKHTITDTENDCCVCLEKKIMLRLKCNHLVCNDCWFHITHEGFARNENKMFCPLCRNVNDWTK